jgi:hypothetical protein
MFSGLGSFAKLREKLKIRRFERSNLYFPFYFRVFFNLWNLIGKFDNNLILPHVVFLEFFSIYCNFWGSVLFFVYFSNFHPCRIKFIHNLNVI